MRGEATAKQLLGELDQVGNEREVRDFPSGEYPAVGRIGPGVVKVGGMGRSGHGAEDASPDSGAQDPAEHISGSSPRARATGAWRAAHRAAGVSYGATAGALDIAPRNVALLGDDKSGKVWNGEHAYAAPPAVRRALGRRLEDDAAPAVPAGRTELEQIRRIQSAALALGAAETAADIRRASERLADEHLVLRALLAREGSR